MVWRLQGSGTIFVCWVSVKLRLLFTAGPYWQVVSARCAVWIFIDLWNLRPQNACSLSFLRPALKICVKNADFCVNANPGFQVKYHVISTVGCCVSLNHVVFQKCPSCCSRHIMCQVSHMELIHCLVCIMTPHIQVRFPYFNANYVSFITFGPHGPWCLPGPGPCPIPCPALPWTLTHWGWVTYASPT